MMTPDPVAFENNQRKSNPPLRLVLVDDPAGPLVLRVHGPDPAPLVALEMPPARALALAADLVEAVRRRIEGPGHG